MDGDISLIRELQERITELEAKVDALRVSRRVLINLIEILDSEKKKEMLYLKAVNEKLKKSNQEYAKKILNRNVRIQELEQRIKNNIPFA